MSESPAAVMGSALASTLTTVLEELDARVLATRDSQHGLFGEMERLHAGSRLPFVA
jgi:hypothetical protein